MRLPRLSIPAWRTFLEAPGRVLSDHPWSAASAFVLCGVLVFVNHVSGADPEQFIQRLGMAAGWGVSLALFAEIAARRFGQFPRLALLTAVPVALATWFALVPTPLGVAQFSQYSLLVAATHLAVALAGGRGEDGFWHWNRALLQRLSESSLFAAALGGGASGALAAVEKLFGLDIPGDAWGDIWIVCATIHAPFHFLSSIPRDPDQVEEEIPHVLRLLSTRVLLPLAIAYLCILYAYGAKILASWELPTGWVSAPVIAFAGFGILAQLLLAPFAADPAERWVRLWTRWFHLLLLPLCVLLGVAIGRRVLDYGFTEERYAVVVVAAWLPSQALWFLSGRRSLKAVPASLLALALLCGWGPWGAFEASRRSQLRRLGAALEPLRIVPGTPLAGTAPDSLATRIRGAVRYLCDHHQGRGLERWSPAVARLRSEREGDRATGRDRGGMSDSVLKSMGIPAGIQGSGERVANFAWEASATFPPRTHARGWHGESDSGQTRFVARVDSLRWVFRFDTLTALARRGDEGESWWTRDFDTALALHDSSGVATLVVRDARLRTDGDDGKRWRLHAVNGILLW